MPTEMCLLVVDDEEPIRELVVMALADAGYAALAAASAEAALDILRWRRPRLILLDSVFGPVDAAAFLRAYRALPGPHATVLLFSADPAAERRASQLGVAGVFAKPFDLDALLALAQRYDCEQDELAI